MEKTLGQIACEAISGPDGWDVCAGIPGLKAMWEAAGVADKAMAAEREACAKWYIEKGWLLDEDDVADAMRTRLTRGD